MISPTLAPVSAGRSPDGGEIRVLIVDDEQGNREVLADIGRAMGYHITTAASGRQALDAAEQQFFHAAILDIRLPDMFGTELFERLRALQPDVEGVMVTGYASLSTAMQSLNMGVAAYIIKPLDMEHLWGVVAQAVDRQWHVSEERRLLSECRERVRVLEAREAELLAQLHRREAV
jgi:two-component system response regulator AtoC